MRGSDIRSGSLFSYVDLEQRVRADHPLRKIREFVNAALADLSADFDALYPLKVGRPSIPPERLLRAMLLQAFYGIRSDRQLMERMEFDLLFRWFVGLGVDDPVWDASSFSKNRDRLLDGEIATKFLSAILAQKKVSRLLSSEHFSVDGTLIEAWASHKSFQPKPEPEPSSVDDATSEGDGPDDSAAGGSGEPPRGRNALVDFKGVRRSNVTHASTTDPDARLARKSNGQAAILAYAGHALMENRSGLIVGACVTLASGTAERDGALALIDACTLRRKTITLGADKAYDVGSFVEELKGRLVAPHIARHDGANWRGTRRGSSVPKRTAASASYAMSQKKRKLIEEAFGWKKCIAGMRKTKLRGQRKVDWAFILSAAAYNLTRLPKLLAA
jgi:transposase